jgi:hypothetical protein
MKQVETSDVDEERPDTAYRMSARFRQAVRRRGHFPCWGCGSDPPVVRERSSGPGFEMCTAVTSNTLPVTGAPDRAQSATAHPFRTRRPVVQPGRVLYRRLRVAGDDSRPHHAERRHGRTFSGRELPSPSPRGGRRNSGVEVAHGDPSLRWRAAFVTRGGRLACMRGDGGRMATAAIPPARPGPGYFDPVPVSADRVVERHSQRPR